MKIINATSGKIGTCVIGPKYYLHETVNLGELAICIARDEHHSKPCVWLIGGIEQLIDYISLAREKGDLEDLIAVELLSRIDGAKKNIPSSPIERLASTINMDADDLKEMLQLAQVCISQPIGGIKNFSEGKPKWFSWKFNGSPSIKMVINHV